MSAKRRTRRELADEAYLRVSQMDLSGALEPISVREPKQSRDVPGQCPECAAVMTLGHGWTALSVEGCLLQCGQCGHSVAVPSDVFDAFRKSVGAFFAARAAARAPLPKRPKKTRGEQ